MFAKGPRFPPEKVSEAPGPGHYTLPEEFRHEAYKKGAFLEKADRFGTEKGFDVSGPGTNNAAPRDSNPRVGGQLEKTEAAHKGEIDRASKLAALQRRLVDIEKVHGEDKKKYQAELEKLKSEVDASRRMSAEQTGRLAQLQKQYDLSESRTKDLKKAIVADQAEIKDLRMKLRSTDQARRQATSCQGEVDELKKVLQNTEAGYRSELRHRDAKSSEQDRALAAERKRREVAEQQANSLKSKVDVDMKEARDCICRLEDELDSFRRSAEQVKTDTLENKVHLDDVRATMARVAEEYGRLAASSVPLAAHRHVQLQYSSLQLRNIRLDRRLADREVLVEQLTDYCRQASEEKTFLANLVQEAENDHRALLNTRTPIINDALPEDVPLMRALLQACDNASHLRHNIVQNDLQSALLMSSFYQAEFEDLLVSYAAAQGEGVSQSDVTTRLADAFSELRVETDALRLDHRTAETELATKRSQLTEAASRVRTLDQQLSAFESEATQVKEVLRKERESSRRLAQALHQSKKNEELLRLEVDGLADDLVDVTRYKDAHADLLAEVVDLIQQNDLAEAEAERLGKFNAEILGHTNPQQKIFYVDRIRRELAETKHRLMQSTRDREELVSDNAALQHEVSAYKSVGVPIELKPRSNCVRIERTPLASRSVNGLSRSITFEVTPPTEEEPTDTSPMTLDEIM